MRQSRRHPHLRVLEAVLLWPPETFIQRKLSGLARHGVQITVASTVPRAKARSQVEGARLLRIPSGHEPGWLKGLHLVVDGAALLATRPRRLLTLIRATARRRPPAEGRPPVREVLGLLSRYLKLARHDPDLVHFEWETAAAHYLPVADTWPCPVVISCRGRDIHLYAHVPGHESWVGRLPAAFERASLVHCVSDAIKREAEQFGLDPAKARVIRPAVDPAMFTPEPAERSEARPGSEAQLRLVGVGELIWPKGWEYALQALHLLVVEGVPLRFDLVGDIRLAILGFSERARIAETVADLGLADRVTVHGRLRPAEVREVLRRSDVFVHPALCEGIPNVVLEAMSCELPVVATDAGGTAEAVRDGQDGFVVPRRDPRALADAIHALWESPDRRLAMGTSGRARVLSSFSLDDQVEQVLSLYGEVTG